MYCKGKKLLVCDDELLPDAGEETESIVFAILNFPIHVQYSCTSHIQGTHTSV